MSKVPSPSSFVKRDDRWFFPGELAYGGDYSPEQWPREVWEEDMALMREAGVNLVSVGIFSWALLQPEEDRFDFSWMDELLDLLHKNGIGADLATPTASPPAWFFKKYPHARAVTREGAVLGFGSRGIVSPSSPEYKSAAVRIATELAERYGSHPAVKMWHVHNEYGAPVSDEYSDYAEDAFRSWLKDRYGTLEALNDAWGTRFWGQYYHEWEQVGAPRLTPAEINPSQRLDFQRFSDWALRQCFIAERDAIHAHAPQPVTTNFMANQTWSTDLWEWAKVVDIVSDDHYLWAADKEANIGLSIAADLTRSLAGYKPWMVLEHSTSAVNWQDRNIAKRPKEMARNSMSHVGRGADAVMFFQWRASRAGSEKFHSAMLPHSGTKSRVWKEVVQLGHDLKAIGKVQGSLVDAEVAMLWDFETNWAQSGGGHPSKDIRFPEQVRKYYEPLWRDNVAVDFAHPGSDLTKYKLVVVPSQYMISSDEAANLNAYVEGGGTLLVSYYSGIVDRNDRVHASPTDDGGFMYVLEPALGVVVEEFLPMREGEVGSVQIDGEESLCSLWQEDLRVTTGQVLGTYTEGPAALLDGQKAAVVKNSFGNGTGFYVSCQLEAEPLATLMRRAYESAGVRAPWRDTPLEVMERFGVGNPDSTCPTPPSYLFVINHGNNPEYLAASGQNLVQNRAWTGSEPIAPGDVAVLQIATTTKNSD